MHKDRSILTIFAALAVFFILLPFVLTFSEALTSLMQSTPIYLFIQNHIVPYEVKIVASVLTLFKLPVTWQQNGLNINGKFLEVTWNCLGWQSLLFIFISFIVGFQGAYTRLSIFEAGLIGICGTFILNISRIIIVSLLGAYFQPLFAILFHNYLAAVITILWLFVFWWFSFEFVLEEKSNDTGS
jgi:exosortase/archaeosortase family protein